MTILRPLLGAVLAFTAACDGCKSEPKLADKPATSQAVVPPEEAPELLGHTGRLNTALQCLNRHSRHIFEAQAAYLAKADAEKGAAPGVAPEMLEMYGIDDCRDATTRFTAASPAMPELDVPLREYVRTLQEYGDAFRTLTAYYQTGEFKKDKGQRGRELHARVMNAFSAFLVAHDALEAQVSGNQRRAKLDQVDAREKAAGRDLEVIGARMILEAESLYQLASREPVAIYGSALDARIAAYAPLVDELAAYAAAHPAEAQKQGSLSSLLEHARAFLEASRTLATKLRDKAASTKSERDTLRLEYNALLSNFNTH